MDRTYILHRIYTSENSAKHRNTQLSEMYPDVAGTKEAVDQFMNRLKRRVDSGRWEEPSEKNWFNSYIEVASLKR